MRVSIFNKALAVFLLLAFSIAGLVSSVHAIEHAHDFHCSASAGDKHIHEAAHDCSLCDTQITTTSELPTDYVIFVAKAITNHITFFKSITFSTTSFLFSGRAPPII
jgi:hypothetical protein